MGRASTQRPTLERDARGAVYVEFLIAFLPLLVFFECLVQLAGLITAKLVVAHAASCGARAASVVVWDDPKYYSNVEPGSATGQRRDDIEKAVAIPLRAVKSIVKMKVTMPSGDGAGDDRTSYGADDVVRVRVEATYRCMVPLASHLVCGLVTGRRTLTAEAAMPGQGAEYKYSGDDSSSSGGGFW